jgi:hypothetical protein
MKPREKMLAIAVGAVVALFVLKWGYDFVADMFQSRDAAIADRTARKEKDETTIRAGDAADRRMKNWQARSLPTNSERGRADYQSWLVGLASKYLKNPSVTRENSMIEKGVTPRGVAASKDKDKPLDEKYRFHIKADSDLKMSGLVEFLYDFYASNHLQTIRNLSLTPDKDKLTVSLDVEAMMLPAAERKDDLLNKSLPALARGDLSAYKKLVGGRDLFVKGGYVPPQQPRGPGPTPPSPPPFDIARYTKVTAIKSVNGEPEIDVNVRTTGQQFAGLKKDAEFKVGDSTYKVLEIGAYDAVLLVDGKDRKHVRLGDMLRDAVPVQVSETPDGT